MVAVPRDGWFLGRQLSRAIKVPVTSAQAAVQPTRPHCGSAFLAQGCLWFVFRPHGSAQRCGLSRLVTVWGCGHYVPWGGVAQGSAVHQLPKLHRPLPTERLVGQVVRPSVPFTRDVDVVHPLTLQLPRCHSGLSH